jgi:hypothetical protein
MVGIDHAAPTIVLQALDDPPRSTRPTFPRASKASTLATMSTAH